MTTGRNMRERRKEIKGKKEWTNRGDESVSTRVKRNEGRGMTIAKHTGSGGIVPRILKQVLRIRIIEAIYGLYIESAVK
jgi:hypothetical protein